MDDNQIVKKMMGIIEDTIGVAPGSETYMVAIASVYSYRPTNRKSVVAKFHYKWRSGGPTNSIMTVRRKVVGGDFNTEGLKERIQSVWEIACSERDVEKARNTRIQKQTKAMNEFKEKLIAAGLPTTDDNFKHTSPVVIRNIDGVKRTIRLSEMDVTQKQFAGIIEVLKK